MGRDAAMEQGLTRYQLRQLRAREAERREAGIREQHGEEIAGLPEYMQAEVGLMARRCASPFGWIMDAVRSGNEVALRVNGCRPDVAARWVAERGA